MTKTTKAALLAERDAARTERDAAREDVARLTYERDAARAERDAATLPWRKERVLAERDYAVNKLAIVMAWTGHTSDESATIEAARALRTLVETTLPPLMVAPTTGEMEDAALLIRAWRERARAHIASVR